MFIIKSIIDNSINILELLLRLISQILSLNNTVESDNIKLSGDGIDYNNNSIIQARDLNTRSDYDGEISLV